MARLRTLRVEFLCEIVVNWVRESSLSQSLAGSRNHRRTFRWAHVLRSYGRAQCSDCFDHFYEHRLRVAVHHAAIVGVEQLIFDAGIALAFAALDDVDLLG